MKYAEELGQIYKRRQDFFDLNRNDDLEPYGQISDDFADEIFTLVDGGWEDKEKALLDEKYKEVLYWSGPLLRGLVGRLNGFEFRVYSNDHGQHFHIIHKEKEINARFSFPEIGLIDYKSLKNKIDRKTIELIRNYFKAPANLKRLETEFLKHQSV